MPQNKLDAFQVIADPSRRHILHLLLKDCLSINALASNFDMSRPAVSKHVKALNDAGFISVSSSGRERYCSLKPDGFKELEKWLAYFDGFWEGKLNTLSTLLQKK